MVAVHHYYIEMAWIDLYALICVYTIGIWIVFLERGKSSAPCDLAGAASLRREATDHDWPPCIVTSNGSTISSSDASSLADIHRDEWALNGTHVCRLSNILTRGNTEGGRDGPEARGRRGKDMSKHSKKGFRKLENHELSEFSALHGDESGSGSEMIVLERENISRRGGG